MPTQLFMSPTRGDTTQTSYARGSTPGDPETDAIAMTTLPRIPKSALAVLKIAGVETLEDAATWRAHELAGLRGFGPKAFASVQAAMADAGLEFDETSTKRSDPVNVAMAEERMKDAPVIADSPTDLPNIGRPARSALAAIDVHDLAGVARHTRQELLALHGFGPKAIRLLEPALAEKGLRFREDGSPG